MTDSIQTLAARLRDKTASIGVVGLGYVGLPAAAVIAEAGFHVTGIDIDEARIALINRGESPIGGSEDGVAELINLVYSSGRLHASSDYSDLKTADVVIICVDTPIEPDTHYPAYRGLRSVLTSLGAILKEGALVIVESTIAPGTMQRVVIPMLEETTGRRAGEGFYVGHCPERVTPGRLLHNLRHVSRPVGGQTPEVAETMVELYRHYVQAELDSTDITTAEIVKTAENAYRDVQIAFANEVAKVCEALDADVYAVRALLNKSPGRDMLLPGAGVGGHCIPKDPWLLIANVKDKVDARLIPAARAVNDSMPYHIVGLLETGLNGSGRTLQGARIAVLGAAFKEDTDDDRDSPSTYLVNALKERGAFPVVHDPYVGGHETDLEATVTNADAVVIMVAHSDYKKLDWSHVAKLMSNRLLVDGRALVSRETAQSSGLSYFGVGISAKPNR